MYPRQYLSSLLKYTCGRLQVNSELPLSEGECLKWLGICLTMILEYKRGPSNIYTQYAPQVAMENVLE